MCLCMRYVSLSMFVSNFEISVSIRVFKALLNEKFYNKVPSIIVLSKGHGSYDTISWVYVLQRLLDIPVVFVGDMNVGAVKVFDAYYKSANRTAHCKYLGKLGVQVKWWGLRTKHFLDDQEDKLTCRSYPNGIEANDDNDGFDGKLTFGVPWIQQSLTTDNEKDLRKYANDESFLNNGIPQARVDELKNQLEAGVKIETEVATQSSLCECLEKDLIVFLYNEDENEKRGCVI